MAANERQRKLVADIEAAVKALTHEREPENVTLSEIMDMAGTDIHNLRPLVMRLSDLGEIDLLKRMQAAFARVGLKQTALEKQLEILTSSPEPQPKVAIEMEPTLKLEPRIPPAAEKAPQAIAKVPPVHDDAETLTTVIRILKPLPKATQAKVINSAAVFLGVGE